MTWACVKLSWRELFVITYLENINLFEGCVMYEGRSQKRSALAARWPQKLCDHILNSAEKAWEKCDQWEVNLAEGREPGSQR